MHVPLCAFRTHGWAIRLHDHLVSAFRQAECSATASRVPRGSTLNTGGHHGQTSPSSSDSALENSADTKNEMERASRDRTAAKA